MSIFVHFAFLLSLSVAAFAATEEPHFKFELPHFIDTDGWLENIFKHSPDDKITVNVGAVQQLLSQSPQKLLEAKNAIHTNDVSVIKRIIQEVKKASSLSIPCILDLVIYGVNLKEFVQYSQELNKFCFKNDSSGNVTVDCPCLGERGPKVQERQWVLDVIDAQGKMPAGVVKGNILWPGSYHQCVRTTAQNVQGESDWRAKYCSANIYTTWNPFDTKSENNTRISAIKDQAEDKCFKEIPVLNYGFCIPEKCTAQDAKSLVEIALSPIKIACKVTTTCHERDKSFGSDGWAIFMLAFLIVITFFVIYGTCYDYFVYQELLRSVPDCDPALEAAHYNNQAGFVKIMLAFSAYTNTKKIFDVRQRPGTIDCLHGLRFFSMLWIILGHTYYYCCASITMDNLLDAVINFPFYFFNQLIVNSVLAVDTFFFLSGLLVTYLWFKHAHKVRGRNIKSGGFWANFYIHRYLRLTPVYMIILGLHVTLLDYMAEGPFWRPIEHARCRYSFWTNLFYLNNFFHVKENACMGWTWYMANDMQFFAFSPVLLILFWKYEFLGYIVASGLILMSGVIHSAIVLANDWPPAPILTKDLHVLNVLADYWPSTYVKPYIRCGPWVMGFLVGYFLYRYQCTLRMKKWVAWLGWMVCLGMILAVVFGTYPYSKTGHMGAVASFMYATFGRICWALILGWIVLACATGHGGPIDGFLSWNRWIPFSRLTYCAYLIHPIVLSSYFLSRQTPMHYGSYFQMLAYFGSMTILSYGMAYLASLAFEIPVSHLETITKAQHAAKQQQQKEQHSPPILRSANRARLSADGIVGPSSSRNPVLQVNGEEGSKLIDGVGPENGVSV